MISRRTFLSGTAASALPLRAWTEDLTSGDIIETATGKTLGFQELLDQLEQADTILIGERHGFAPHQNLVALILEELALRGRFPTLALEMLEPAQMPALEAYRADNPEYVGALGAALDWANTGWPAWSFYEPIFRAAFRAKLDVVAADLPREEQRDIDQNGEIVPSQFSWLIDYWKPIVASIQCNPISDRWIENVATRQTVRDRHISAMIVQAHSPLVALVGNRHMEPIEKLLTARESTATTVGLGMLDGYTPGFLWHDASAQGPSNC
ncbi:ChaN family lipoprotein [uncultured Tateyamaria sp.]|uniref:ChaN family lipoprotein n=1 Tax=uncultured Tateyamaria sp. TaxID=455651 RepID=UPI002637D43D|nr:ChaN family lipoprotein [uncultured Tateyamaria sp.]